MIENLAIGLNAELLSLDYLWTPLKLGHFDQIGFVPQSKGEVFFSKILYIKCMIFRAPLTIQGPKSCDTTTYQTFRWSKVNILSIKYFQIWFCNRFGFSLHFFVAKRDRAEKRGLLSRRIDLEEEIVVSAVVGIQGGPAGPNVQYYTLPPPFMLRGRPVALMPLILTLILTLAFWKWSDRWLLKAATADAYAALMLIWLWYVATP